MPVPPASTNGRPDPYVRTGGRSFITEVADAAQQVRFGRVLIAVVMAPFLVVGFLVGLVWLVVRLAFGAVLVGFRRATAIRAGEETKT